MRFSVVIPAYNEEKIIGEVIEGVDRLIREKGHGGEVIVVDDGSKDGTAEAARAKGAIVLVHKRNIGYGAALKTGIAAAKSDVIVILDGDGSYPVDEIPALLAELNGNDMVVGARTKKREVKMSFLRRIPKFILGKLAEYLVKERIPDINSGLRVFKKSMYEKYVNLLPDTFSFTLTITLAALSRRESVKFVPISYHKRKGISKIRPVHDTLSFLLLIVRTILYFNPVRVFLPLAAIFILAALAIAFHSIFIAGKFLDVTVTLIIMLAVQMIMLGLVADLIDRKLR
jgi:glycosyltransferase involved in cell wall biosynthesis